MTKLILTTILVLQTIFSFSQGVISGSVKDANTGEPLIGASVYVQENQVLGTMTDYNGDYSISIPPGKYTLVCSYISYQDQITPQVIVINGSRKVQNYSLKTSAIMVDVVTVTAKVNEESEFVTNLQQQKASVISTTVGAEELSRKGVSSVADGVKKVSGISMIGSKQLFVRGLGDRYNQTTLNEMPIASPDPTKKIIKLDYFPSDVVKSIDVSKVYNSQNYADYAGAQININTKDYPETAFLKISAGTGLNNQTTFNTFMQASSVVNPFFGLGAAKRSDILPEQYTVVNRKQNSKGSGEDPFKTDFGYDIYDALPTLSASVATGKLFKLPTSKFGVLFLTSFGNDYSFQNDLLSSELKADGTTKNTFLKDSYTYETRITSLLNLAYISNKGSVIKANIFQTTGSEDVVEIKDRGWSNEGDSLLVRNSQYNNNSLIYSQLIGTHNLGDSFKLSWKTSLSNATSTTPDRRQTTFEKNGEDWTIFALNLQETLRLFKEQEENVASGDVSMSYTLDDKKGTLNFGSQAYHKTKDYKSYVYYYDVHALDNVITDPYSPQDIFSKENFEADLVYVKNGNSHSMKYDGTFTLIGSFLDLDYNLTDKIVVNTGIRHEYGNMIVNGYSQSNNVKESGIKGHDLFPALNVKYVVKKNANIRIAASRTIIRPSFYEMSPATIIPKFGEPKTEGNADLQNAYNANFDLKYEIFPSNTDLYSISAYGKVLKNPIEMLAKPTGGSILYTFENTEKGYVGGLEFEMKKNLNENIFLGCNASYIYTYIQVSENANETEKERSMQGSSPYLLNADLGYQTKYGVNNKTSVAFVYNVYGKRMYAVGTDGMGSVFELPFHTLDLVIKNNINESWDVNFKVKNILNQKSKYVQGVGYEEKTKSYEREQELKVYQKGVSLGFNLVYTFN